MSASKTMEYWVKLGTEVLNRDWKMLIGGEFKSSKSGETYETHNPATGELLGNAPFATKEDVYDAVAAAKEAFSEWRKVPPIERGRYVRKLANALRARIDEFAVIDTLDSGNPINAMIADVQISATMMEYMAGLATEMKGETFESSLHWHLTRREPYGVVARIIPYNHPIFFAASKIAGPLIAGNTVVLKAPDQCPLSSLLFGEICKEILPPGVVNIISGNGRIAGDALVRHPAIKRIGFIGSVETGQIISKSAAEEGIKHLSLELGGKNAMMVYPDVDIDKAVAAAVNGMNFNSVQGQSCGSTSRLFLHEDIYEPFMAKLKQRIESIKMGLPIDPDTQMGCLVSKAQFNKVNDYISSAHEEGATLVTGGKKPEGDVFKDGYFIEPTVFENVTNTMRIFNEEIFGPVLSVIKWNDQEETIRQINQVPYGLTGAVWTNDIQTAMKTAEAIESGFVWINGTASHYLGVPFQGYKNSGLGSEEGLDEILSYTQVKTVNIVLS